MKRIQKKHSFATRWFHWLNFPILFVMIWSGLLIYWANDIYKIQLGQKVFFRFFPDSFNNALGIPHHLAKGMAFHFFVMWFFFVNGFFMFSTRFSRERGDSLFPTAIRSEKHGKCCCTIYT